MVDHFWKEASARDPSLRYEDLRLWNMDLKETSTLQSFRAEYEGQTIWSICNSPTYSVDPAHRPPSKWSRERSRGSCDHRQSRTVMYVDDINGIEFEKDIATDLTLTRAHPAARYTNSCGVERTLSAPFNLSVEAIIAIQCWGAMLCLVRRRETEFTRSIASFAPETPTIVAEFDSSLSGAGLIWYGRDGDAEVEMGVSAANLLFLGFGEDSSFQNLSEFLGAILAILGQIALGFRVRSVALKM